MLQKCSIFKVAGVFFKEPTKDHYLIEVSKKIQMAHTSVKNHLKDLQKAGIIKERIEEKGKRKFPIYRANIGNEDYKEHKKIYNLLILNESKLIEYLNDNLMPNSIVLFGSYQRGEDIENSDIDIFLECKEGKIDISKFEKMLNRKIQLHFKERFKKYPPELKNNIINGIILKGYLEAF